MTSLGNNLSLTCHVTIFKPTLSVKFQVETCKL